MYLEYEIEELSDHRLIHELVILLERHFKTQKRLDFYSDRLEVSLRRLNAICIYHLHKTLYELIQERRFNESKKLLESSTLSVKEITYYLGFCDPPYFIRYFKKQTGLTPRRYRLNLLEKWQEEALNQ